MSEPPKVLYLQWYGDQSPDDCEGEPAEVAWSEVSVFAHDVEYRHIPDADDPRVLRRALRLAIFALYDEKLYVPTAADPQNYIDQARRELESEGSDET